MFNQPSEFYEGQNVIFNNCTFNAGNSKLPVFSMQEIEFKNCTFIQKNDTNFKASAKFNGITKFLFQGKGKIDASEATFEGKLIYNKKKIKNIKEAKL